MGPDEQLLVHDAQPEAPNGSSAPLFLGAGLTQRSLSYMIYPKSFRAYFSQKCLTHAIII